jgi:hypothetical protein
VNEIWAKFTKNERLVAFGAAIVIIAWVVGAFSFGGFGVSTLSLLGAIAVLAIYYLKYAPNQNINWPAPVETIVLGISGIIAILAVISLIQILGILTIAGFGGIYLLALLAVTAGAVVMAFGAWNEYQATAASRAAAAPPASTAPPAAPSAPPPAASSSDVPPPPSSPPPDQPAG